MNDAKKAADQTAEKKPIEPTAGEDFMDETTNTEQAGPSAIGRPMEQNIVDEPVIQTVIEAMPRPTAIIKPPGLEASAGERIRRKREASGLTRYALERVCGITATTIRTLELGRAVKETTLAQIEQYLDSRLAESAAPGPEKG